MEDPFASEMQDSLYHIAWIIRKAIRGRSCHMDQILNQIDFRREVLHSSGFGGSVFLMSHKEKQFDRYVVKLEKPNQSYNEFYGQRLISALGYDDLRTQLMQCGNEYFGAIPYIENLHRIYVNDISTLLSDQRKTFVALYVLNGLMSNPDEGEFYTDAEGRVHCLDLGETVLSEFGVRILGNRIGGPYPVESDTLSEEQECFFRISFNSRISLCLKHVDNSNVQMQDEIIDAGLDVLFALAEFDIDSLRDCFDLIEGYISKDLSDAYRVWLKQRIRMAQNALEALEC